MQLSQQRTHTQLIRMQQLHLTHTHQNQCCPAYFFDRVRTILHTYQAGEKTVESDKIWSGQQFSPIFISPEANATATTGNEPKKKTKQLLGDLTPIHEWFSFLTHTNTRNTKPNRL